MVQYQALNLQVPAYGSSEGNTDNIRYSLSLGLPEFVPSLVKHDGTMVVVGSGPSLPTFIEDIRKEKELKRPIMALNGSHDFLVENGIIPDVFMTVDPRPMLQNLKNVNDQTVYLIASRAHPSTFDSVKGKDVVIFHSWSWDKETELLNGKFVVTGGTTSGTRSFPLGHCMGFRKFVAYGLDSCLAPDGITKRFTGEKAPNVIDIHVGEKVFYTNPAMGLQAQEFQILYTQLPDITIDIKGNGLLAAIQEERKKAGLKC